MRITPFGIKPTLYNWAFIGVLASLLSGCSGLTPTRDPIPFVTYHGKINSHRANSGQLLVFLPGRADKADDFRKRGMLDAFRRVDPGTDVIAVQAHMGYYVKRELATRLHEDVLLPAIAAGKTDITLVGLSLGGLGSLIIEQQHPGVVVRRVLIAPFVGDRKLIEEIAGAGGVDNWQPGAYVAENEPFRDLWAGLKVGNGLGSTGSTWLLLGENDRYIAGQELLAGLLAPQQTLRLKGKHNWRVWLPLWEQWLAQHQGGLEKRDKQQPTSDF